MDEYLYKNFVQTITTRFNSALSEIQAIHNFDLGNEFENALCKVLRLALPQKFGICRGHVVNQEGEQAGDDIIIYDTMRFPTLRLNPKEDYSKKEWIPIEAVYAYIEAKHTLNVKGHDGSSFEKCCKQVARVKDLCSQREPKQFSQILPNTTISNTLQVTGPVDYPPILNPIYTMIFSRQVREKEGKTSLMEDDVEIRRMIVEQEIKEKAEFGPDALVLGKGVIGLPVIPNPGHPLPRLASPFLVNDVSKLTVLTLPDNSFGVGLSLLLYALDWIHLGHMPWPQIIINGFNPRK